MDLLCDVTLTSFLTEYELVPGRAQTSLLRIRTSPLMEYSLVSCRNANECLDKIAIRTSAMVEKKFASSQNGNQTLDGMRVRSYT